MSNKTLIIYLDENNQIKQGYFELIHLDSSFVKFKTHGDNIILIPTCRILKIKEGANSNE